MTHQTPPPGYEDFSPRSGCSSPSSLLVRMKNTFLHFEETFLDSPRIFPPSTAARARSLSDSSCGSGGQGERRNFDEHDCASAEFVMVFEDDKHDFQVPPISDRSNSSAGASASQSPTVATPSACDGEEPGGGLAGPTTVMLRNIPNKYTQKKLMEVFEEKGFAGRFDFFYLPMDFRHNCNLGFAFANFDCNDTLKEFTELFEGFKLPGFNSTKVCQVSLARVQGLQANIDHYQNSPVAQVTIAEYKPVVLPLRGTKSPQ